MSDTLTVLTAAEVAEKLASLGAAEAEVDGWLAEEA